MLFWTKGAFSISHFSLRIGTWFWDRKVTLCRQSFFPAPPRTVLSSSGGMVFLREVTPVGGKFIGKTWPCIQGWLWVDSLLKASDHSLRWRMVVVIRRHLCIQIHCGYMYIYIYIAGINMTHIGHVMISNDTCFLWINDLNLVTFSLPATPDTPADTRGHCLIWQEVPSFGEGKGCHIGTTQANQRIKSLKCCFIWNSYGKNHEDCVRSSLNLLYAYCWKSRWRFSSDNC